VALGEVGITVNKNSVPSDVQRPTVASGIRIGTAAITTRGFSTHEASHTAALAADVLEDPKDEQIAVRVSKEVRELTARFPVYQKFGVGWWTEAGPERGLDDRQQGNPH
jgi:glycine hydroxymethyltransferase